MAEPVVEIYSDGACRGNPGPGGWGALLRYNDQEKELWGGEAATTNNRMELVAAIRALEALKKPSKVKLYTDTIASIKSRGIIGEKFLALSPGGGGDPLKPGDIIRDTESGLDLEELVSQYVHGNVSK